MVDEKKDIKKINKVVRPAPIKREVKKTQPKEEQFFAKDLADKMGITGYDFLLVKREAGIQDGDLITMSEMQKLYNKVVRR